MENLNQIPIPTYGHTHSRCFPDEFTYFVVSLHEAAGAADGSATAEGAGARIQSLKSLKAAAELEKKAVRRAPGQGSWKNDPEISPFAGSLSVLGLTIDDLTFASVHGTATKLNDVNEAATLDHQMRHLGRRRGNPLFTIAQKSVIGHGLGASGASAINGGLQATQSGVIPGNRNADDIDGELEAYGHLLLTGENVSLRAEASFIKSPEDRAVAFDNAKMH
ncbi:hypothetical protein LA080_015914 [Diaporthe eres]|nr:hypothetical protein LA080_015914 [Diaporthe eres]